MSKGTQFIIANRRQPLPWIALGGLMTAILFVLYLAPDEATLGSGIQSVYVHVALSWTGMSGLILTGILGLILLAGGSRKLLGLTQMLGWVALGFYLAGIVMSAIASQANWGGIFWREPRMLAAVNSLAISTILLVVATWLTKTRFRGLCYATIPLIIGWITYRAPRVLHPANPIFSSESSGIQLTFVILFLLFTALFTWVVWQLAKKGRLRADQDQ